MTDEARLGNRYRFHDTEGADAVLLSGIETLKSRRAGARAFRSVGPFDARFKVEVCRDLTDAGAKRQRKAEMANFIKLSCRRGFY